MSTSTSATEHTQDPFKKLSEADSCSYLGCGAATSPSTPSLSVYGARLCVEHDKEFFSDRICALPSMEKAEQFHAAVVSGEEQMPQSLILRNILCALVAFGGRIPKDLRSPESLVPYLCPDTPDGESYEVWKERLFIGARTVCNGEQPILVDSNHFTALFPSGQENSLKVRIKDLYLPNSMIYLVGGDNQELMSLKKLYGDSVIDSSVFALGVCGQTEPDGDSAIPPIRLYVTALMVAPREICEVRGKLLTNFLSINTVLRPSSLYEYVGDLFFDSVQGAIEQGLVGDASEEIGSVAREPLTRGGAFHLLGTIGLALSNIVHRASTFDVREQVLGFFDEPYLQPKTLFLKEHLERLGYPKLVLDEGWNG